LPGLLLACSAFYLIALVISLAAFRRPVAASSLQALNSAFPNMAFMGVPVLTAVIGTSAVLSVVIGNLISSFVLLPLTLTLLETGTPKEKGAGRAAGGLDFRTGGDQAAAGLGRLRALCWR